MSFQLALSPEKMPQIGKLKMKAGCKKCCEDPLVSSIISCPPLGKPSIICLIKQHTAHL